MLGVSILTLIMTRAGRRPAAGAEAGGSAARGEDAVRSPRRGIARSTAREDARQEAAQKLFRGEDTAVGTPADPLNGPGPLAGPCSSYDTSITSPGSQYPNVQTNVTKTDFQANLLQNGYNIVKQTNGSNGPVTILSNGQSTYTIYTRTSTGQSGAQYFGPDGNSVKFSLGGP